MKRACLLGAGLLSVSLALGGTACGDDVLSAEDSFNKLDRNGDGTLTAADMSDEQMRFFDRLLRVADKDGDNQLSRDEFAAGTRPAPPTGARLDGVGPGGGRGPGDPQQLFQMFDRNGDGRMTRDELPERARERLAPLFDRLGKDELTRDEFVRAVAPRLPRRDPRDVFRQLDADGDGRLTRTETGRLPDPLADRMAQVFDRLGRETMTEAEFVTAAERAGLTPPDDLPPGDGAMDRPVGANAPVLRILDTNRDGRLSRSELARAVDGFEPLDRNGDGQLDPQELFGGPAAGGDGPPGRPVGDGAPGELLLNRLDRNGDGRLTRDEVPAAMRDRFDQLDRNADGEVDRDELRSAPRPQNRPFRRDTDNNE